VLFTAHIIVGSAVGLAAGEPGLALAAGFVSHHIIDALPHSDSGSFGGSVQNILSSKRLIRWVWFDVAAGSLILAVLIFWQLPYWKLVFFGAVGGVLTDVIDNSPFWSVKLRRIFPFNFFHRFHEKFHFTIQNKKYIWIGWIAQIILIVLSLYYILIK